MKKTGLTVIFAASLELTKQGVVTLSQKKVFGRTCVTYWRSLGCLLMSLGGLWEVSACPLDVSRMSWDVLRRSLGGSLQPLETPDVVFQSGFLIVSVCDRRVLWTPRIVWYLLDGTPFWVARLRPLFQHCLFGMTLVTYWRSFGGLRRSFGGL